MKKYLSSLLFILFTFIVGLFNAPSLDAASANIRVTSDKTYTVVGSTVNVTVTVSSSEALGSWEYTISYDSGKLRLDSGSATVVDYGNGSQTSATYYYKFKVLSSGSSTVSVKSYSGYSWGEELLSMSAGSVRISAVTQSELEASYSKNNNLSNLVVDGAKISPDFNKDVTDYSVSVPSDTEKIKIDGAVEDGTASVSGFGEFEVSEGENKFEIIVTAQNGSTKKYSLKVTVEDKNPIEVIIDKKKYTVVKRASSLKAPATYEATTQLINGIEVPGFKSKITNYILVGLKSEDGNTNLYIYNESENSYTLYREIKTEGIVIFPKKAKVVPDYYKITKIKINNEEVEAYQYDGIKDFYLIYGVNIEKNEEGFYEYDVTNNTITRYNDKIINELAEKNKNFELIIIVLGSETILLVVLVLFSFTRRKKKNKKLEIQKDKTEEVKDDFWDEGKTSKKEKNNSVEKAPVEEKNKSNKKDKKKENNTEKKDESMI